VRRSLIGFAIIALMALAACSATAATTAPSAAPASAAAPTTAPTAAPTTTSAAPASATPASAAPTSAAPTSSAAGSSGSSAGQAVSIKNFSFNPATVASAVGGKVTWTNGDDAAHTVTFDDASVTSSGNLNTGQAFVGTFSAAGTFTYHCAIHPGMKGTVTVS
jgi:plastocyanin